MAECRDVPLVRAALHRVKAVEELAPRPELLRVGHNHAPLAASLGHRLRERLGASACDVLGEITRIEDVGICTEVALGRSAEEASAVCVARWWPALTEVDFMAFRERLVGCEVECERLHDVGKSGHLGCIGQ